MGTAEQNAMRSERLRLISGYVREFSQRAPVRDEAVWRFAQRYAQAESSSQVRDDLMYLASVGDMTRAREWSDGEWVWNHEITAQGIDRLEGRLPPL